MLLLPLVTPHASWAHEEEAAGGPDDDARRRPPATDYSITLPYTI